MVRALIQAYLLFQVMKELVAGSKKAIGVVKGVPEADSGMVSPPSLLMPSASVVRHRRHSGRVFEQNA
jgi:hypothetical protein